MKIANLQVTLLQSSFDVGHALIILLRSNDPFPQ
jgi:hypothetical protein